VVLKPAPAASATALRLGEMLNAVLPADLVGIVLGDAETGTALVTASDCVSFTGSTRVGASVVRAAVERGVPVQAEMGGQNAAIVFSDADPEQAADQITTGAFSYSGQKCTATRRVILVGDCSDFVDALVARAGGLIAGDPADERTDLGPVIDATAHGSVTEAVAAAELQGGRLLTDRHVLPDDGYFVAPTLVDGLPDGHRLLRDEVFGPVCALLRVSTEADAVRLANSVRYGLVTGIYTADLDRALRLIDDVETGVVKVNAPTTGVDFHLPFGGDKDSSFGAREQGKAARDFYTHSRTVTIASAGA
jgi:alpha-ketoglutaric semialdehyde dehydrogenase